MIEWMRKLCEKEFEERKVMMTFERILSLL